MNRFVLVVAAISILACGKNINNKEAVRAAIVKRVAKTGFDVNSMTVDVTQVSFHDQDAVATVSFVPKGGPAQSAVSFKYNLHRQGDEWVATGLSQSGNSMGAHTGGVLPPSGGDAQPGSSSLPQGHPPVGKQQ